MTVSQTASRSARKLAHAHGGGDGEAHFHDEQGVAGEGGGFLAGGEVFDVHAVAAEDFGDAVDEAGLIEGVGFEFEGHAFDGGGGAVVGEGDGQAHAGGDDGEGFFDGGEVGGFEQDHDRDLPAEVDHVRRIEDVGAGAVEVAGEFAEEAGTVVPTAVIMSWLMVGLLSTERSVAANSMDLNPGRVGGNKGGHAQVACL